MRTLFSIYFYLLSSLFSLPATAAPHGLDELKAALAPYLGSYARPYYHILKTTDLGEAQDIEFSFDLSDGVYRAKALLQNGRLTELEEVLAPELDTADPSGALSALGLGDVRILADVKAPQEGFEDRRLVAFVRTLGEEETRGLASVSHAGATLYKPVESDRAVLRELSFRLARYQARQLAKRYDHYAALAIANGEEWEGPKGPVARLEVELKLSRATARKLVLETAEESAVGFYPPRDFSQYSLASVLGDNAIFVTLGDGAFRVEDFN